MAGGVRNRGRMLPRTCDGCSQETVPNLVLLLFSKDVCHILFARNMFDLDQAILLGGTNEHFTKIHVAEFLGNGTSVGPVDGTTIVIVQRGGCLKIREAKKDPHMSEGEDGVGALVGGIDLGFTRAL